MSAPPTEDARPSPPRSRFARLYGRGPFHLAGHVVVIAITAYVLSIMFEAEFAPRPLNLVLWLLGGAILHDLVFLPAYSAVNVALDRLLRSDRDRRVPLVNHVRTPLVISGVLLVVFLPRIADRQPQNFVNALGHEPPDFLGRWLLVTGALAAGSALLYAVRRVRAS